MLEIVGSLTVAFRCHEPGRNGCLASASDRHPIEHILNTGREETLTYDPSLRAVIIGLVIYAHLLGHLLKVRGCDVAFKISNRVSDIYIRFLLRVMDLPLGLIVLNEICTKGCRYGLRMVYLNPRVEKGFLVIIRLRLF